MNNFGKSETGEAVFYDNTVSGLAADNVKDAIDLIALSGGGSVDFNKILTAMFEILMDENGNVLVGV